MNDDHIHGVFTEREAIAYLRLTPEDGGPRDPGATLRRYRALGLLRGVRIGRHLRYPRIELDRFIERLLERQEGRP